MKTREFIVYRQGSNWIVNDNGVLSTLPYYVETRKDVLLYLASCCEYGNMHVVFAK